MDWIRSRFLGLTLASVLVLDASAATTMTPPAVRIDTIDEVAVKGAPMFIERGWVRGSFDGDAPSAQFIQLAAFHDNVWHVLPGLVTRRGKGVAAADKSWAIDVRLPVTDAASAPLRWRLKALLLKAPLPVGRVADPNVWRAVTAQSGEVLVWWSSFSRSAIRIREIGGLSVAPGVPNPVSQLDQIEVDMSDIPAEAVLQVIVQAADGPRVWPQAICHGAYGESLCNAVFGRSETVGDRLVEIDMNVGFIVWVVASTTPLPVGDEGIDSEDFLKYRPFIKATSDHLKVVRSIPLDGLRIAIDAIGSEVDGHRWEVPEVARVTGSFSAGPRYRQLQTEIVTLLIRAPSSPLWTIAGTTRLTIGNRSLWRVLAADFESAGQKRAIATVTLKPLPSDRPITESVLTSLSIAVSEERRFYVVASESR